MLRLQVSSGNKVLLEKSIPVRTLRYTGKTYFDETIFFGGSLQLEGRARNHTKIPTVKMVTALPTHQSSYSWPPNLIIQ
jgi:hypothetical protein